MNFIDYVSIAKYLAFFTILYYIFGLLLISKIQSKRYLYSNNYCITNDILIIVSVFIFFSFCDGDNFHYIKWFYYANHGGEIDETSPQEPFYQLLSYVLDGRYFLFRILIWGSAIILFSYTSKRLRIPPRVSLICLYCLFLFLFSYARATLGMCVYFYGFSFLINPLKYKRFASYIIGIIFILLSVIFHTSMTILILFTIPILLFPSFKDTILGVIQIILYIIALVFFIVFVIYIIEDYIESLGIPILSTKFSRYTELEEDSKGIFNLIIELSISIIMILCLYVARKSLYRKKANNFITDKLFLFSLTLLIVGLTLSFMGSGYAIISYRIKYMTIVPITLLCANCIYNRIIPYKKIIVLETLGVSLTLFRIIFYYYLTTKGLGIDMSQSY